MQHAMVPWWFLLVSTAVVGCFGSGSKTDLIPADPSDGGVAPVDAEADAGRPTDSRPDDEHEFSDAFPCPQTGKTIEFDEVSSLGFSVAELVQMIGGSHSFDLYWAEDGTYVSNSRAGTTTSGTLTVDVLKAWEVDEGGCMPIIVMDTSVQIRTDDGALDETVQDSMVTTSLNYADFSTNVDPVRMRGDYLDGLTTTGAVIVGGPSLVFRFNDKSPFADRAIPDTWNGQIGVSTDRGVSQGRGFFPADAGGSNE